MINSQVNYKDTIEFSPTFNKKAFDLKSYQELEVLAQQELLATLIFSYLMQLENPVRLFGNDASFLTKGQDVSSTLYVNSEGVVGERNNKDSIFSITIDLNTHLLNASVANVMKTNPDADDDDISTYCMDAFLIQVAPQIWNKSQFLIKKLKIEEKHSWLIKATHYAAACGFTPYSMYADLLLPLIGMIYKTKNKGLN